MKYIVKATQLITQDVEFIVTIPEDGDLVAEPAEEFARRMVEGMINEPSYGRLATIYDARDEDYLCNIVTKVRPATEEESK